jgi:hypothetical protein
MDPEERYRIGRPGTSYLRGAAAYIHAHGLINYIDTKAICCHCHPKKLTCKGTLRQVFIRVYRLEIQSVMLVFSTQLCELSLSNALSGSTLSP